MLWNPMWEPRHPKPDPFALSTLIAWLETKPPAEEYIYTSNGACLLAQYFTAKGFKHVSVGSTTFNYGLLLPKEATLPQAFHDLAINKPCTFGQALIRARDYAKQH